MQLEQDIFSLYADSLPFLSEQLASLKCRQKLLQVLRKLPENLGSRVLLFESHLNKDPPVLDFSFSLQFNTYHAPLLEDCFPNIPWQALSEIFSLGVQRKLWLEFDVGSGGNNFDVPNLFFSLTQIYEEENFYQLVSKIYGLLHQDTLSQSWEAHFRHCAKICIKMGCTMHSVGFMLARTAKMVRWNVQLNNVRGNALKTFIHELGYGDEYAELFFCMDMLDSFSFNYYLAIDIGETAGPRLGLECHPPAAQSIINWEAIFSHLAASSCILPTKIDASLAWSGKSISENIPPDDTFPMHMNERKIGHLKLVATAGSPLEAKIYLSARCNSVLACDMPIEAIAKLVLQLPL